MPDLQASPTRETIEQLQAAMARMPQASGIVTEHEFFGGLCLRKVSRPADCTIVGKVHKREHLYLVLKGEVTVTCHGLPPRRLAAGDYLLSAVGTKRAVYAHTDAVCMTIHAWNGPANPEILELDLVECDETALFDARNNLKGLLR